MKYLTAVFLAFFVFGIYEVALSEDLSEEGKQQLVEQAKERPFLAGLFVKSLDQITPTVDYPLPFTDRRIFTVNQFPFYSWIHLIVAIPLVWLVNGYLNMRKEKSKLRRFAFLFVAVVAAYLIGSWIAYAVYHASAAALGLSYVEAATLRGGAGPAGETLVIPALVFSIYLVLNALAIILRRPERG